jgi:integrase
LDDNEIPLAPIFKKNLYGRGSQQSLSDEYVPSPGDLSRIIEFLPIQGKCLVLVLSSSGLRVSEALQLRLEDINFDNNPVKVRLRSTMTKTKSKRITFLSTEAVTLFKEWLKYREMYIQKTRRRSTISKTGDTRVFPFIYANISKMWILAVEKSGLLKKDTETGRITLRLHNLRKYFRTYGHWSNTDYPEILMGHQGIYARYSEEQLAQAYKLAEPHLSIGVMTSTVIELKERVQKQQSDMGELATNLTVKNAKLENEMNEMQAWRKNAEKVIIMLDPVLSTSEKEEALRKSKEK